MTDLHHRQQKMQAKRKITPWRQFLKEIVSLRSLGFYRNGGHSSVYPDTDRIKGVVSHAVFEESRDALTQQGHDYDFSHDFFENFTTLFLSIDQPPTRLFEECENCEFSDQTVASKNCYLSYVTITDCENILYSLSVKEGSTNVFNSTLVWKYCENIYTSMGIINASYVFYSKYIQNSSQIWFSENLIGCMECLFCHDIENQSYCIHNKVHPKDVYFEKKQALLSKKNEFLKRYVQLSSKGNNISSHNVTGNFNIQCEDIEEGYNNYQIKQGRNIILIGGNDSATNIYDCFLNTPPQNHYYGVFSAGYGEHIYNSYHIKGGGNVYYSVCLEHSSYCIGCVGLRNKQFCVLNKQYTKEERFKLADKIFAQMEQDDILGNFFPGSLNPFYFNDSTAYLIDDSFTKEEVEAEGYLWRDEEVSVDIPEWMETVEVGELGQYEGRSKNDVIAKSSTLGNSVGDEAISGLGDRHTSSVMTDTLWWIDPTILKKVIKDEEGNVYRVIKMEYDFLMKYGLPLPRLHRLDRLKQNFKIQ